MGDGHRGRDRRGGNAKYLFLQIAKNQDDKKIVWVSHKQDVVTTLRQNGYTAYDSRSWKGMYRLLRAKTVFCTNAMDFSWWITGGAEIVQLWHGVPFKKGGWDVVEHRDYSKYDELYRKHVEYNWDTLVTTSKNPQGDILRRAFRIDSEDTVVTGFPRTDIFFNDIDHLGIDVDSQLLHTLHTEISADATVFMYAPTWRRDYRGTEKSVLTESQLDLTRIHTILEECNSYLILKLHPMEEIDVDVEDSSRILIAESGSDPYPLLKETDCLISDYSSIYIDFLMRDMTLIFYPYDLEEYTRNEGLYYTYRSITLGYVTEDNTQLYEKIRAVSNGEDPHKTERKVIRDLFYDNIDGNAAERIYEQIVRA